MELSLSCIDIIFYCSEGCSTYQRQIKYTIPKDMVELVWPTDSMQMKLSDLGENYSQGRYNGIQYNMIVPTSLPQLRQNMNQSLNP